MIDLIARAMAMRDRVRIATDFPTLQASIDDLPLTGGAVYVPPGLYQESVRITKPNVHLLGTWASVVMTPGNATTMNNDAAIRVFADGCTIEGLQINGNRANNAAIDDFVLGRQADGIAIYANNCTVRNNWVHDCIGHNIIVWNEAFPSLALNVGRHGVIIDGNLISGAGQRAGIDIASTQDAGIVGNVNHDIIVTNNRMTDKIFVIHTSHDVVVQGNSFVAGASIHTNSKRVLFAENLVGPTLESGIKVVASQAVTIRGNKTVDTAGNAIDIDTCTHIQVSGNLIQRTGSGANGIVYRESSYVDICDNIIIEPNSRGVGQGTAPQCSHIRIRGNTITTSGIGIDVGDTIISEICNNYVQQCATGIFNMNTGARRLKIQGNTIRDTASIGAYVYAENSLVQDNLWDTSAHDALRIGAAGIRITGNEFRSISGAGVRLVDAPARIIVDGNRFASVTGGFVANPQGDTIQANNYTA